MAMKLVLLLILSLKDKRIPSRNDVYYRGKWCKSISRQRVNIVFSVNISNILNPLGPFSVSEITRLIKGSEEKIVTYGDDSISSVRQTLNDVVVTDVSAFEYLERDTKGLPSVTKDDSIGKAGLKPIMFNVPL